MQQGTLQKNHFDDINEIRSLFFKLKMGSFVKKQKNKQRGVKIKHCVPIK